MIKFGVARKYAKDLPEYILTLNQSNIDAYEIGFAYGSPERLAEDIITLSKNRVKLSCHLPLWINLGNPNNKKNIDYLIAGLKIAEQLESVGVFHLGFYGNRKWDEIKYNAKDIIKEALSISDVKKAKLGIETTGKQKAIGTVDEIIELIKMIDDERVIPIIDWSHLYARSNGVYPYTFQDFREILENFEREIGYKPFYFHGGGIKYKNGNEIKHISAKVFEPPLPYLFTTLRELGYNDFTLIVESPDSIEDVKWLKRVWQSPREFFDKVPPKRTRSLFDFRAEHQVDYAIDHYINSFLF